MCISIGRTDAHVEEMEFSRFRPDEFFTTQVDCLCIDVDMDAAWERHDVGPIQHEICRERQIASAFRLPYNVFRTGGRGHQAILPLPAAIDRSAATWLLQAFLTILVPYHEEEGGVKADASNLERIVRLAGGRHIITQRLALWIDPETGRLHDLTEQERLMQRGYRHPRNDSHEAEAFRGAAEEISAYLESLAVFRHEAPKSPLRELLMWQVAEALPDNLLVERFRNAEEQWGLHDLSQDVKAVPILHVPKPASFSAAPERNTPDGLRRWAERVWAMEWGEGTFWDWVNEGGHRGISAAKMLYGDQALEKLIERTYTAPHVTPGEPREWRRVIAALYARHQVLSGLPRHNPRAVQGDLSEDDIALISEIMDALHAHKKIQSRNRQDIEHVVHVLLLALKQSQKGYIDLSQQTIRDSIRSRWPDAEIDVLTVWRHLRRLTNGNPQCGFSLLQAISIDRHGQNMASRYRPGPDLRQTSFGASLRLDDCQDFMAPQTWPKIEVRSAVTGKPVVIDFTPKKRGRKPKNARCEEDTQ